ncbi:MAG: tRNA (mnm(5)s(2)U34)-methyltransferase [Coprobacillaceae bacterium]
MRSMIEHIHQQILNKRVGTAIDFTMGNGHDTLVLSKIADIVYSFDIQELALQETRKRLSDVSHVKLIQDNHLYFDNYVQAFDLGIFNLGYLPNGNHEITTIAGTTFETIKKAIQLLNMEGFLYIVVYIGHKEGQKESEIIQSYVKQLHHKDYNIAMFTMLNKSYAPYVIEIEKRKI